MNNKKLGVVGGMGPMATSMFFERIIERTVAHKDQDHIDMVILNHASMPDRTHAILTGDAKSFLENMEKDLKLLETIGVAHIAIPCNTAHYFMEQMKAMTSVKIIDMVEETAQTILDQYGEGTRVGILATDGTVHTGTYKKACLSRGLDFVNPEAHLQREVMKTIYDIKAGEAIDVAHFESIIKTMVDEYGCKVVILACTELSLIQLSESIKPRCIDAMDVLIEKSIVYSGKAYKQNGSSE